MAAYSEKKGFDSALNGGRGSPWVIEFSVQRYDRLILLLYNGSTWWRSDSGGVQRIVTLHLVPYCLFVTGNFMCIVSYKNNSHCIWFISSLQLKKRSIFLCVVQEVSRDWSDMWSGRGYHRNIFCGWTRRREKMKTWGRRSVAVATDGDTITENSARGWGARVGGPREDIPGVLHFLFKSETSLFKVTFLFFSPPWGNEQISLFLQSVRNLKVATSEICILKLQ